MSLIKDYKGPKKYELLQTTLEALDKLGGSGRIDEINEKIIDILNLTDEIIEYPHANKSYRTELVYQLAWTRTMLKHLNLLRNKKRGVWVLTQKAMNISRDNDYLAKEYREFANNEYEKKAKLKDEFKTEDSFEPEPIEEIFEEEKESNWKQK